MKAPIQDGTFQFVRYEGSTLPQDPNVRSTIRRRAMKHTAAIRKQNGGYGRHNVFQFPVLSLGPAEQYEVVMPHLSKAPPGPGPKLNARQDKIHQEVEYLPG